MHTGSTASDTLDILWNNYLTLCEEVDLDSMHPEALTAAIDRKLPVRPFRIAAWLARQGFFISVWSLWEYYARNECRRRPNKVAKKRNESAVGWVGRSLAANGLNFTAKSWFENANGMRNLIAHHGARATEGQGKTLLERARCAFGDIETWQDGYVNLTHCHVAELHIKIEDFVREIEGSL